MVRGTTPWQELDRAAASRSRPREAREPHDADAVRGPSRPLLAGVPVDRAEALGQCRATSLEVGLHRLLAEPEDRRDLGERLVLHIEQGEHLGLAGRQLPQSTPDRLVDRRLIGRRDAPVFRSFADAGHGATLGRLTSAVRDRPVDHRPPNPEVGPIEAGDLLPPLVRRDERLLGELLGDRHRAAQRVGQPHDGRILVSVEPLEDIGGCVADPTLVVVGARWCERPEEPDRCRQSHVENTSQQARRGDTAGRFLRAVRSGAYEFGFVCPVNVNVVDVVDVVDRPGREAAPLGCHTATVPHRRGPATRTARTARTVRAPRSPRSSGGCRPAR